MEFVRSYDSTNFGLPSNRDGSAPALRFSRPVRGTSGCPLRILGMPFRPYPETNGLEDSPNSGARFGIVPACRPAFRRSGRLVLFLEI